MTTTPTIDPRVSFLHEVMKAGRRGVFVDDGGGHHNLPPDVLVQDFLLYVGVIVENVSLDRLNAAHAQWLANARFDAPLTTELHCTEILSGKKAWTQVPRARRVHHLGQACLALTPMIGRVIYAYIGKKQYEELIRQAPPGINERYATHKTGLPYTFYKGLAAYLSQSEQEAVVLHDQGLRKEWDQEVIFANDVPVWEQSIIHVRSDLFAGVQLADLVAWTYNRMFRVRARLANGEPLTELDLLLLQEFPKMWEKTINLWDPPTDPGLDEDADSDLDGDPE
jgi:hypothetical protein